MKKTQIIKEIVGKAIKEYGFRYLKTDGPSRIFIREVQAKRYYDSENQVVKQYIDIQESSFSRGLTARFYTDVYGYEWGEELEELRKYGLGGWLPYMDEDSYKDRLYILAEAITDHGLDLLEKMSHEEEIIPTKAMAEILFRQHRKLADEFAEKFHIKIVLERPEDVDELFDSIKK